VSLSSPANDSVGTAPYVACRGNAAITGGSHGADTIVGGASESMLPLREARVADARERELNVKICCNVDK
jgi:hypothetical protein